MASYRECVAAAAEFLQLGEIAAALKENKENELNESDGRELELLMSCAGFVSHEIAVQYCPLSATEEAEIKNGRLPFSALGKPCAEVACIMANGVKKRFKPTHDGAELYEPFSGKAYVSYTFAPSAPTLDGEIEWKSEKLGARVLGYGIACEYCIVNGMSEAVTWDKRYKDALAAALRPKRELRVKKRRWL